MSERTASKASRSSIATVRCSGLWTRLSLPVPKQSKTSKRGEWKITSERLVFERLPVGKVAFYAMKTTEELLKFAEGSVTGDGTLVGVSATTRELRLVAVEHRPFIPTRHLSLSRQATNDRTREH